MQGHEVMEQETTKFVTEFSNVFVEMNVPDEYCLDLEIVIHKSKARICSDNSKHVRTCPKMSRIVISRGF